MSAAGGSVALRNGGRRVEKDDQSSVERYVYSGAETVSVYDGSNIWVRDFVFGSVIDEVLMIEQADVLDYDGDSNTSETTRSFYHRNALGSVMEITDMNEAEVVSYRYDPYGAVTITRNGNAQSSDPLGQPWMYTVRFHDEETGLEYYRARYYSTSTGRFLQRDPLGYTEGPNPYAYAICRPIVLTDPMGLSVQICWRDLDGVAGIAGTHSYIRVGGKNYGFFNDGTVNPGTPGKDPMNEGVDKDETCITVGRSQPYLGGAAAATTADAKAGGTEGPKCKRGPCDHLPPDKKRCCLMTDAEIEVCVQKAVEKDAAKAKVATYDIGSFTCGTWAAQTLDKCCLNGDDVPTSSRGDKHVLAQALGFLGFGSGASSGKSSGAASGASSDRSSGNGR